MSSLMYNNEGNWYLCMRNLGTVLARLFDLRPIAFRGRDVKNSAIAAIDDIGCVISIWERVGAVDNRFFAGET